MSTPLTLPNPSPASISWTPESAVASSESPFSFRRQVYDHGGKRNRVTIGLPTMSASEGREWQAFFRALNGMEGEFYVYPVTLADPQRGTLRGAPVVNGAGQTGQALSVSGWVANALGVLRAGDWLSIGDRLYTVTEDVDSNALGIATLKIWPNLATAPAAGELVETRTPRGIYRLSNPAPTLTLNAGRVYSGVSFEAIESL